MLKNLTHIYFTLLVTNVAAQKTVILDRSNFKHDYVLERAAYLEELKDTLGCKYIATLDLYSKDDPMFVELAMDLLGIKAKELGANAFYISSHSRSDSMVVMTVKLHYAFKKMYDLNKTKVIKNKIVAFSFVKRPQQYLYFYVNDSLKYVKATNYFVMDVKAGEKHFIKSCNTQGITLNHFVGGKDVIIYLKGKMTYWSYPDGEMICVMLYSNEFVDEDTQTRKPKQKVFKCGMTKTEYRVARVLMEIYKPEN